eukprot:gene24018-30306_t
MSKTEDYGGGGSSLLEQKPSVLKNTASYIIATEFCGVNEGVIFTGMYIVALGAGGIKPNCSTMGADQFNLKNEQDARESKQFFSFFYWSINLGALLAYTLVAYICQYGLPGLGGETWGFFVGYLIPTVMLGVGIAVFVSGSKRYVKLAPGGSMVSKALGIFYEALILRRGQGRKGGHWLEVASVANGGSYEKIGLGFIFALFAMLLAAIIEVARIKYNPAEAYYIDADSATRDNVSPCRNIDNYNPYKYQEWYAGTNDDKPANCWEICPGDSVAKAIPIACIACDFIPQMSHLSIFWQIPQFVVIGISEIFSSITSLEFFYSQAPHSMRSVSQALNLFTNALGSWLTIPLTLLVNSDTSNEWITSDVNEGHLDYYFYLLAGLMFAGLLVFVYLSWSFVYIAPGELEKLNTTAENEEEEEEESLIVNDVVVSRNSRASREHSSSAAKSTYSPVRARAEREHVKTPNVNSRVTDIVATYSSETVPGIEITATLAGMHEKNAERFIQTIKFRKMVICAFLSTITLLSMVHNKQTCTVSPYQLVTHRKPRIRQRQALSHLSVDAKFVPVESVPKVWGFKARIRPPEPPLRPPGLPEVVDDRRKKSLARIIVLVGSDSLSPTVVEGGNSGGSSPEGGSTSSLEGDSERSPSWFWRLGLLVLSVHREEVSRVSAQPVFRPLQSHHQPLASDRSNSDSVKHSGSDGKTKSVKLVREVAKPSYAQVLKAEYRKKDIIEVSMFHK